MRHKTLLIALLTALVMTACGDDKPADPAPDLASADMALPDASPELAQDLPDLPPPCPDLDAPGTTYTGLTITADQLWRAADSPHRISATTIIEQGATITVEPCAILLISPKQNIEVRGALVTQGTEEQPVTITSTEVDQPFGALQATGAGTLDLTHTRILHGGARAVVQAMIELSGDDALPLRDALRVDHVWLFRSQTEGVSARHNAAFSADSDALSVTEPAQYPIHTTARLAGTVPPGFYTNAIAVNTDLPMIEDTRWAPRGVPYRIGDRPLPPALRVGASADDAPEVTWTIEPGAELVFSPGGSILLNARRTAASPSVDVSHGTLIAQGSAQAPIIMRYISDDAGAWQGIVFRAAPTPASRLDHVLVKNAGGTTQANSFHCAPEGMGAFSKDEDAAITLYGPPASAFITNTTISSSAGDGINHAYSAPLLDLLPSNTFQDVAGCNQTLPRDADGRCPQQGYCPK